MYRERGKGWADPCHGEQRHRLPREAVEPPFLETFKTRLDAFLCPLLWVCLLKQGVGRDDLQRSLATLTIL